MKKVWLIKHIGESHLDQKMIDTSAGCCKMSQKCQPDLVVEVSRVLEPTMKANSSSISTLYSGPDNKNNSSIPLYFPSQLTKVRILPRVPNKEEEPTTYAITLEYGKTTETAALAASISQASPILESYIDLKPKNNPQLHMAVGGPGHYEKPRGCPNRSPSPGATYTRKKSTTAIVPRRRWWSGVIMERTSSGLYSEASTDSAIIFSSLNFRGGGYNDGEVLDERDV